MGLLKNPVTQDALLDYGGCDIAPPRSAGAGAAHLLDDSPPLGAARGILLAATSGSLVWALILLSLL